MPDKIPANPQGTITFKDYPVIMDTPNERAASFNESAQAALSVCSVDLITIGSIIMANAKLPDMAEKCTQWLNNPKINYYTNYY